MFCGIKYKNRTSFGERFDYPRLVGIFVAECASDESENVALGARQRKVHANRTGYLTCEAIK